MRQSCRRLCCLSVLAGVMVLGSLSGVFADIYINVMAVNGSDAPKSTMVKYNLPGELKIEDVLDTDGLQLDYNVNDASYYVHEDVTLKPKESKTYKLRVRDVWKITDDQVSDIKKNIEEGSSRLGKVDDPSRTMELKTKLTAKLDYIVDLQNNKSDSIERRIDSFRTYAKEIKRIRNDALSVEYWRSDPVQEAKPKIIRMAIEVENPPDRPKKIVKIKQPLPIEVKPENVVESEGFELRFNQQKQESFLYKEEELDPGQKKRYNVGIEDVWHIPQKDIDYLRSRAVYANDFLKNSKYASSAVYLFNKISAALADVESSQTQDLPIVEHIGVFRGNAKTYETARTDVESLEKLLATYREILEKTKVDNVLKKMGSLKSVSDVSDAIFKKKLEVDTAWKFIGWVLLGAGVLTIVSFGIWSLRSKDKKVVNAAEEHPQPEPKEQL